jgi:hypothetical protein
MSTVLRRLARGRSSVGLVVCVVTCGALLLLLALGGVGAVVYSTKGEAREVPAPEWQPFAPAQGGFTVLMPGTPTDQSQDSGRVVVKKFEFERLADGARFSVTYDDLPLGSVSANSLDLLANAKLNRLVEQLNGRVSSAAVIELGDVPGREFRLTAADGSVLVSRVYLTTGGDGHRLYELVVSGHAIVPEEGDAARFFDSFRVDDPAPPPKPPGDPPE